MSHTRLWKHRDFSQKVPSLWRSPPERTSSWKGLTTYPEEGTSVPYKRREVVPHWQGSEEVRICMIHGDHYHGT